MRRRYATDLTDAQWDVIRGDLPPAVRKPGCEPTDLREVVNALMYQNRTGCPWHLLPHDLPAKSTVFDYYTRWQRDGTWDRLLDGLRRRVREKAGRDPEPTAAAADSQSVPTTQAGGEDRGYDGGKKVKGRKRHVLVDTTGLLLSVVVTAANVSDGRVAPGLMDRASLPTRENLRAVFGDGRYNDRVFREYLRGHPKIALEIGNRPAGSKGFVVIRVRWVVERTFGWLVTYRRLVQDYEKTPRGSETRVKMAGIHMMLKRLTRGGAPINDSTSVAEIARRKVS